MARKQRARGTGSLHQSRPGAPWVARWYDHAGKRRERSTRTHDRTAAERILRKWIGDAALRRDGVIDARADVYAAAERRPLADHLGEWEAAVVAKGVTAKQVALLKTRAQALIAAIDADRLSGLSASAVQSAVADLRDNGTSLKTCNHYLRAIKQFSRWLHRDGRTRSDSLAHLAAYNAATDKRRERRPLDADELRRLIAVTAGAPAWRGLSGADRSMLYRVAAGTGFRAAELRSLTPASFQLDDDPPAVVLKAGSSKHRREDRQPIRRDLAELVATWLDGREADEPCWPGRWHERAAEMIRGDLRRARARWIKETPDRAERRTRRQSDFLAVLDADGRVADFHALRVSYITLLVKGGASVKVAQELARHSDPKLTLNVYTRLGITDLAGALGTLPAATDHKPQPQRMRALGTFDHRADAAHPSDPRLKPRQLTRESAQSDAKPRTTCAGGAVADGRCKPLAIAGMRDTARVSAEGCETSGDWIRTSDLRAMNPLGESATTESISTYSGCGKTTAPSPANSAPEPAAEAPTYPDLQAVVEAWPDLPAAIRAGILALVRAAK